MKPFASSVFPVSVPARLGGPQAIFLLMHSVV